MAAKRVFQPIKVGNMQLEHRISMAPLTRFRARDDHVPSELVKKYYAQRGSAGGTLLITEATFISPRACGYRNAPGLWTQDQINGWREVTDAVHAEKSFIFNQLWALGRVADPEVLGEKGFQVHGPSNIPYESNKVAPIAMTKDDIQAYVKEYAQAAKNAIEAGFDGVEIHGANGYLIDQFWQECSNDRADEYGGSPENRARFGLEVTKAIVAAIGDSKKVGMRLSPFGTFQGMKDQDPIATFSYIVQELQKLDLAYLHLIESREDFSTSPAAEFSHATQENDALIKIWGKDKPIIFAGGFTPAKTDLVLEQDYPDYQALVAYGRHFISTPDLVQRLRTGTELNKWDRTTFYGGGAIGYTDYPFAEEVKA